MVFGRYLHEMVRLIMVVSKDDIHRGWINMRAVHEVISKRAGHKVVSKRG